MTLIHRLVLVFVICRVSDLSSHAFAQNAPKSAGVDTSEEVATLRKDMDVIRQAEEKIEKDLEVVRDLVMGKQPPPEKALLRVAGRRSLGDPFARIAIVEFSDFQCLYFGAYERETFQRIIEAYVKTGKAQYIVRNFPLDSSHPLARKAAEAALCARDQGKYWEARDRLFANQARLKTADMTDHAIAIRADPELLKECIDSGKYADEVEKDLVEGKALGVRATPTFLLGYTDAGDNTQVHVVKSLVGALPYRDFQNAVDDLLNQVGEVQRMHANELDRSNGSFV